MNHKLKLLLVTVGLLITYSYATCNKQEAMKFSDKGFSKAEISSICDIQAQIDELNKKLDTASDSEMDQIFAKIDKLNKEKTGIIIAQKDAVIKKEKEKQAKLKKIEDRLSSIEGSLNIK